jgi:Putative zinc-finger
MSSPRSCELARLDAAYVLGALSPEERLEFERHLPGCPACSRAVQDLAGMPGLLARVSSEVVESEPLDEAVPDTLLPALVREVRRSRQRRGRLAAAVAAVIVLAVGAGSVAVVNGLDDDAAPSASPSAGPTGQAMTPVRQHNVVARVALTSVAWGTRLELTCSYASPGHEYGGSTGLTYALVIRSREGDVEQVATWRSLPGKTMSLAGATALRRDDIASVEVRTADGRPVLELLG